MGNVAGASSVHGTMTAKLGGDPPSQTHLKGISWQQLERKSYRVYVEKAMLIVYNNCE